MAWLYLFGAGLFEVIWAGMLKQTDGFTRPLPTAILLAAMAGSVFFMSLATRTMPIGMVYAIWCAFGIIGTTILGSFIYGDALTPQKMACIALIGAGIVGLKLSA